MPNRAGNYSSLIRLLREGLPRLIDGSSELSEVKEIVYAFRSIALAHARALESTGRLRAARFGLRVEDLALDCIAQLFARDSDGGFPELASYYTRHPIETLDDVALMRRTRALISGAFDNALYRRYGENDPSLSRLIRSVRRACVLTDEVELVRRFGRLYLTVDREERLSGTLIPREDLERLLVSRLSDGTSVRELVTIVAEELHKRRDDRPYYPLVGLALAIRSAAIHLNLDKPSVEIPEEKLEDAEARSLIGQAVADIEEMQQEAYVGTGKMKEKLFRNCLAAIREVLHRQWDGVDDSPSLFGTLQEREAGLTREHYRNSLRTRCEYLLKLTRARIKQLYDRM